MTYRETEYYNGYRIQIIADEDPPNPRQEYDNFGHMVAWHRNYNLGDRDFKGNVKEWWHRDFESFKEYYLDHKDEFAVILTLYLYDHSGITMRVDPTGFEMADSDAWDWGPVGLTYCTLEEVWKEYGIHVDRPDEPFALTQFVITPEMKEKAKALLISEVKAYDQYLTGDVWGYVIDTWIGDEWTEDESEGLDLEGELDNDAMWEEIEDGSCWGFFGKKYCLEEAKMEVDAHIKYLVKEEAERVAKIEAEHELLFVQLEAIGL